MGLGRELLHRIKLKEIKITDEEITSSKQSISRLGP
jgi:hypothetical protein